MMESPLTESTEIGLEDVEQFSPEKEIVVCLTNVAGCTETPAQRRCSSCPSSLLVRRCLRAQVYSYAKHGLHSQLKFISSHSNASS